VRELNPKGGEMAILFSSPLTALQQVLLSSWLLGIPILPPLPQGACPEDSPYELAREQVGNRLKIYCGTYDQLRESDQIRNIVANYEKKGSFRSPLNDKVLCAFIVKECQRTGVPLWLLLAQAKRETSFGKDENATVKDGRTFTDGNIGNAHNLFNIRPGQGWQGKVLDTGNGGRFRVYDSYQDCIRDYVDKISTDPRYKGKTLEQIVKTYFDLKENGAPAVEDYIKFVTGAAHEMGYYRVDRNTVPVP
jgi:hypothetical protein